jgi:hypothetical protein
VQYVKTPTTNKIHEFRYEVGVAGYSGALKEAEFKDAYVSKLTNHGLSDFSGMTFYIIEMLRYWRV